MNNKPLSFLVLSALVTATSLVLIEEAQAEIYKCVNAKAEVFYNDKPCPWTQIERKVKAVKDPRNGYVPAPFSPNVGENSEQKDAAAKNEILANQTNDKNVSAGIEGVDKNKNSTAMNSNKNTVASANNSNSNPTESPAKTDNTKRRYMR